MHAFEKTCFCRIGEATIYELSLFKISIKTKQFLVKISSLDG